METLWLGVVLGFIETGILGIFISFVVSLVVLRLIYTVINNYRNEEFWERHPSKYKYKIHFVSPCINCMVAFILGTILPVLLTRELLYLFFTPWLGSVIGLVTLTISSERRIKQRHDLGVYNKAFDLADHATAIFTAKCAGDACKSAANSISESCKPKDHKI